MKTFNSIDSIKFYMNHHEVRSARHMMTCYAMLSYAYYIAANFEETANQSIFSGTDVDEQYVNFEDIFGGPFNLLESSEDLEELYDEGEPLIFEAVEEIGLDLIVFTYITNDAGGISFFVPLTLVDDKLQKVIESVKAAM